MNSNIKKKLKSEGFRKKAINSLAQQTICLRTLNKQTLMRKSLCVYWRKFQSSLHSLWCLNEIFLVASCLSTRKKETITEQCRQKSSLVRSGTQTKTFVELLCTPSFGGGLHEIFTFFSAVHILLSITAFLTNSLILVALHKESSLHRPSKLLYRSLATTDLLVGLVAQPLYATYWMSLVQEHWSLCRYAFDAAYITGSALFLVSLMTMTAISVDRLLALLLGLRYKQIVTLKRTYIIVATFWILAIVSSLCALLDDRIILLHRLITILLCLVISLASYTKIFRTLRYHQVQAEDPVQQQPSQLNLLNIAQYRKAVYGALWVKLALVVCFAPFFIVVTAIAHSKTHSSHLVILRGITVVLVTLTRR